MPKQVDVHQCAFRVGVSKIMSGVCLRAVCARSLFAKHLVRLSNATAIYRRTRMGCGTLLLPPWRGFNNADLPRVNGGMVLSHYRCLSNTAWPQKEQKGSGGKDTDQFKLIYKFPAIRFCRTVSRLKLLQTSITFILLPPVYYLYWQGDISSASVAYYTGIAVFASVMLYAISYYIQRFIGMMYLNEANTTVKVSHLTFWGQRNDLFIPVEHVMTLDETGDHRNENFLQFKQYNSPQVLYFTPRFGQIVDEQKFVYVFGRHL